MKWLILLFAVAIGACAPETLPLRMPTEAADPHHVVGSFDSSDGTHLFWQAWRPEGNPRGLVVIHHGLKSHSQHYEEIAQRLNREGYAVYAFDMRGHGRSEGQRASLDDFTQLTEDLDRFIALARSKESADLPLFLMGHSVGGCVVTLYTLTYQPKLAGLVVLAPALRVDGPILLPAGAPLAATLTPNFPAVDVPDDAFRREPAGQAEMAADPLIYHPAGPARTGGALLRAIETVWSRADTLDVPLLGLHGDDDRATDIRGTIELVRRAKTTDKQLLLYHGVRHDLLHEPEKNQVSTDLVTWITSHTH